VEVFQQIQNLQAGLRLKTPSIVVGSLALSLTLSGCAPNPPPAVPADVLKEGGATIQIRMDSDVALPRADADEWVRRAAVAVSGYLGHFPVEHLVVLIHRGGDDAVGGGVTYGGARIEVRVGSSASPADLRQDWVMTHEMFHLAFPGLDDRYLWMMEGLSDYLEPIARARAGQWTAQDVWKEFVEGLPQGLPMAGEGGLDNSMVRERIYWGGNLYWLVADVQIRAQTGNRHSLDDAIRAILADGGNGSESWPLDRVLEVGDKATGTTELKDLYEEMGPKPDNVDLNALWKLLGVNYNNGAVTFDDAARLAYVRQAITTPVP
jgi:hypothetical protein